MWNIQDNSNTNAVWNPQSSGKAVLNPPGRASEETVWIPKDNSNNKAVWNSQSSRGGGGAGAGGRCCLEFTEQKKAVWYACSN